MYKHHLDWKNLSGVAGKSTTPQAQRALDSDYNPSPMPVNDIYRVARPVHDPGFSSAAIAPQQGIYPPIRGFPTLCKRLVLTRFRAHRAAR